MVNLTIAPCGIAGKNKEWTPTGDGVCYNIIPRGKEQTVNVNGGETP